MNLFAWILANTLFIGAFYTLTYAFYKLMRSVPTARFPSTTEMPFVSVLVPARNEENKIGRCLASLLAQDYPNFEIIVIDDRSTDRTAEIIQYYIDSDANTQKRIKFVHGKDAPEGWIGKCNALAHAVGYASGDWFVFTDADTYHHPNSIRDAISYAVNEKVDLLSFIPVQELGSFPEKLIMPVLLSSFLLGDPFHSVNDPEAKRAYAYGQYTICRRNSYQAIGGHGSVRGEIVEDHALGMVFKEKGYKICVADGRTLYSVRMYTNLETLWQGWTKNLYSLIDSHPLKLVMVIIMINSIALSPFIQLFAVLSLIFTGHHHIGVVPVWKVLPLLGAQFMLLFCWFKTTSQHHAGIDWRSILMYPFGSLAVSALHLHAAFLVLTGRQVNWKGRHYVVNTAKTIEPLRNSSFEHAFENPGISREPREVSTIR